MNEQAMRVEPSPAAGAEQPRRLRLAAFGDGLLGPLHEQRERDGMSIDAYRTDSVLAWLRQLVPSLVLNDTAITPMADATTLDGLARIDALDTTGLDAVLLSFGLDDCLRTMTGTAPDALGSIRALEQIADKLIGRGVTPVFVLPPPSRHFLNGLFADRYLAIAASLRRMARQRPKLLLVDATAALHAVEAKGIEPDPRFIRDGTSETLNAAGALKLATLIGAALRDRFGLPARHAFDRAAAINPNPLLLGQGGEAVGPTTLGAVPDGFSLDTSHAGGVRAFALGGLTPRDACLRLLMRGRYRSTWPFIRLVQALAPAEVASLDAGRAIEVAAEYELASNRSGLAFLALQLTPVWREGFGALLSGEFDGTVLLPEQPTGLLRTPSFRLTRPLDRLSLSLMIFFEPTEEQEADATLTLHSIRLGYAPINTERG